ncbi:putative C2 domain-containing protein [Helianthus annuus]|uniref:C2 domain-containing protein n=1 Tax=Helianthus annuus TaxID=4232 RepID=A0A251SN72_HELAN|nr:leucine-rich repeat extensin-like protein 5 [Helianthus annuus]KAF5771110.1 putative C2 domain-containing protein [Helianthus annuus]KAJ0470920.1 putative C2 domain-containing protein [Helianthus annuus]KAJ0657981.1 putative C2 domain-containing protein [Helianthus annuus]KAJ0661668.1 putative C2 domain-containing protein [Helianthus annuus]KAJ0842289.1 putative C2 domain-containing protein [Helianthus annuus]
MATTASHRPPPRPLDLEITIVSAKHLKNVNWRNGDLTPYVIFWLDPDRRLATKSDDSNSTKPIWNERFLIPVPPSPSPLLTLEIFHSKPSDTPKPLVGSLRVPINDLPNPDDSTVVRTFDLRRPSGRPDGKIRLKLAIRERVLPDYQNTPQPAYYYATAPHSNYGRFPPSVYNTSPSQSLPPPPPPPAAPSPPPPPPQPTHTYHYGAYSDPYSGYYQSVGGGGGGYYSQPPAPVVPQTPRAYAYAERSSGYGGPSAPVDNNAQYESKPKTGVGALSGGLSGLSIDDRVRYEEEKHVGARELDDYSDYRRVDY